MARLRVHMFLNGLDTEFDQVRGEILRKDQKLDLKSTYAYVRREFQQRQTMGTSCQMPESSAMAVHRNKGRSDSSSGKSNDFNCNYYGKKEHLKQRCYKIIGYTSSHIDQPNVDAPSLPNVSMNNDDKEPLEELVLSPLTEKPLSQNDQANVGPYVTNDSLSNYPLPSRLPQRSNRGVPKK
ncbi:hypothetical protein KY290_008203 [Solanum tuberosum]|uniref:Integrase core domain containing protein n=1 Tax=Solanum tuberosum TaxID=4113 RepID=A0ABQ7WAF4_SOLTU|nr:hypothetical protein KY290_008203 [Solanum tuberosum]